MAPSVGVSCSTNFSLSSIINYLSCTAPKTFSRKWQTMHSGHKQAQALTNLQLKVATLFPTHTGHTVTCARDAFSVLRACNHKSLRVEKTKSQRQVTNRSLPLSSGSAAPSAFCGKGNLIKTKPTIPLPTLHASAATACHPGPSFSFNQSSAKNLRKLTTEATTMSSPVNKNAWKSPPIVIPSTPLGYATVRSTVWL